MHLLHLGILKNIVSRLMKVYGSITNNNESNQGGKYILGTFKNTQFFSIMKNKYLTTY